MKMVWETQKILGDPDILVNPTCVRVPVFFGHAEADHIETREPISVEQARDVMEAADGVTLLDRHEAGGYPTPVTRQRALIRICGPGSCGYFTSKRLESLGGG